MNTSYLLALKQSYQDMMDILDKMIQSGDMPMGIPKSVDMFANPDSNKLLPMVGQKTDYSKFPSISITIMNGKMCDVEPKEEDEETPDEESMEDYLV